MVIKHFLSPDALEIYEGFTDISLVNIWTVYRWPSRNIWSSEKKLLRDWDTMRIFLNVTRYISLFLALMPRYDSILYQRDVRDV